MSAAENKIALVTGAGSGIGRAVAHGLLDAGWSVALAGRRADALAETAAGRDPARTLLQPTDVANPASVEALFAAIRATFGRLDLLFNNAGVSLHGAPDELAIEDWMAMVSINLTGSFLCARGAFAMMRAQDPQGGRIINNGSISAHAPRPNSIGYTSTKHAINGLTKSLSLDGRKHRIACGQIDIGNAQTAMGSRARSGQLQAHGEVAVEPMMDLSEVVRAVMFMATLPLDANVQTMTVMATHMPFVGRG
jgi:NADP-dependent 3-hydroxy acid dehydrogenase YdfG